MITRILVFINVILVFASFWKDQKTDRNISYQISKAVIPPPVIVGDLCDGTLGENIFTDGDFGSGPQTNLPADPVGYAPGYLYEPNPPPLDGYYTITNNTSSWGSFAGPNWINVGDNSGDPNGYMMVINASYDPGIFYTNEIDGLCENTFYQFSADVINLLEPLNEIKPNISFLINGVVQYSTGPIPENATWTTYGFTFSTDPGVNNLTLSIRNNAPGGNGNDLAIDNISFRACGPEINVNTSIPFICDGESASLVADIIGTQYDTPVFQWQQSTDGGATWGSLTGETNPTLSLGIPVDGYLYRLVVANDVLNLNNPKCRVISNAKEIEITPIYFTHFDTLCQGLELQVGNSTYNQTGVYLDSLTATYNCDSIVTTNLEIVQDLGITADFQLIPPACTGENNGAIVINNVTNGSGSYQYAIDGMPYQDLPYFENLAFGEYLVSIRDHYGCDMSTTLVLNEPLSLSVTLPEDVTIGLGFDYQIIPQVNNPIDTFYWQPVDELDCADCFSPLAAPTTTTTYQITVVDETGCTASDNITITVDDTRHVYLPNAFSPDGNGYNDFYTIYTGRDVENVVRLQIFNRWGAVVFSKTNFLPNEPTEGWDGMFNGKKTAEGVYVVVAEILYKDGKTEVSTTDLTIVK